MLEFLKIFHGPQFKSVVLGTLFVLSGFGYEYMLDKNENYNGSSTSDTTKIGVEGLDHKGLESISTISEKNKENNEYSGAEQQRNTEPVERKVVEKYISNRTKNEPGVIDLSISILDEHGGFANEISNGLSDYFRNDNKNPRINIFNSSFYTSGVFTKVFNGEVQILRDLNVQKYCDLVVLGKVSFDFKQSSFDASMKVANSTLTLKLFENSEFTQQHSVIINSTSTGWSESEAKQNAIRELVAQFNKYL